MPFFVFCLLFWLQLFSQNSVSSVSKVFLSFDCAFIGGIIFPMLHYFSLLSISCLCSLIFQPLQWKCQMVYVSHTSVGLGCCPRAGQCLSPRFRWGPESQTFKITSYSYWKTRNLLHVNTLLRSIFKYIKYIAQAPILVQCHTGNLIRF